MKNISSRENITRDSVSLVAIAKFQLKKKIVIRQDPGGCWARSICSCLIKYTMKCTVSRQHKI